MSQPFYHLRPNKYVDRCLFVNTLDRLSTILSLQDHRYIGFGSFLFDDFKLMHDRLNISSMISLECNQIIYDRANFNVPYNCISIINQSSTDFISSENWGEKNSIIWLDYTSPKDLGQQFSDLASLTNIVLPGDIIKVTLNAHAQALGDAEEGLDARLCKLKERIAEYIPSTAIKDNCSSKQYPLLLLRCLHKLFASQFTELKHDERYVLPLYSTVYRDGQTMVTFTCIVLDDHSLDEKIKCAFSDMQFINFEWDSPSIIKIPDLTVKEMIEINKLLPSENAEEQIKGKYNFIFENNQDEIQSYISFYKYYPSFHSVNF